MAGAGLYLWGGKLYAFSQSPVLRKFITPLPGLGPTGLPVAAANTSLYPGVDFYTIRIGAYTQQFHPDLPGPSHLWGYADITDGKAPNHRYLGGVIVANRGTPVRANFVNELPPVHPLSVDRSIPAAGLIPGTHRHYSENRAAVHLHGGFIPWVSDGGPFHWFDGQGNEGLSRVAWLPVSPSDPRYTRFGKNLSKDYWWPNAQSARLMWYHDHAVGITRLNAYAGIATAYLLLDDAEQGLIDLGIIPGLDRLVPLVVQDKSFIPVTGNPDGGRGGPGDLWYPNLYEKNGPIAADGSQANPKGRWEWGGDTFPGAGFQDPPNPSCVPEFFADTPVVNGMAYPYVEVEPRRYRLLFLNGSQARFYNMQLYFARSNDLDNPLSGEADLAHATHAGIPSFVQIANEGGFLPAPVVFPNNPPAQIGFDLDVDPTEGNATRYNLLLAPGERADVIVDFSNVRPGSVLILYNDAPAPFPGGDPRNDYYTGDPNYTHARANADGLAGGAPSTKVGRGPNTRTLMQIRVKRLKGAPDAPFTMPTLPALDPDSIFPIGVLPDWISDPNLVANLPPGVDVVRDLTLNEYFDQYGRLIQLLGTTEQTGVAPDGTRLYGQEYFDPATLQSAAYQNPKAGAVEVWRIFNTTGDTHPMHFHLVNVQVLSRQAFDHDVFNSTGALQLLSWAPDPANGRLASPRLPDPNELGWKETVRMNPGECIVVAMRFGLPPDPVVDGRHVKVPYSPRFLVMGVKGYEYVWHCHILEHEEHDMMHSMLVRP
jgi:spore coat protein A